MAVKGLRIFFFFFFLSNSFTAVDWTACPLLLVDLDLVYILFAIFFFKPESRHNYFLISNFSNSYVSLLLLTKEPQGKFVKSLYGFNKLRTL